MSHSHGLLEKELKADFFTDLATLGNLVEIGGNILYAMDLAKLTNDLINYFKGEETSSEPPLEIILPLAAFFGLCALGSVFAHRNTDILLQQNLTPDSTSHIHQHFCRHRTLSQHAHAQSGPGKVVSAITEEAKIPIDYDPEVAKTPLIQEKRVLSYVDAIEEIEDQPKGCWSRLSSCFTKVKSKASLAKESLSEIKYNFGNLKKSQKFFICGEFVSHGSGIAGVTIEVINKIATTFGLTLALNSRAATQATVSLLSNLAAIAPIRSCINGMVEVNRREIENNRPCPTKS